MKTLIRKLCVCAVAIVVAGALAAPATAGARRDGDRPRANQGRIPERAPREAIREGEHLPGGRVNDLPHVNHNHWYGHAMAGDARFHLGHPYEHGHFARLGPSFRYHVARIDRDRHMFWLPGGFSFEIAAWDWPVSANWCWDCGDDFVVYDDTGHPGWYLVYDSRLGSYVHATFMGA
jgi:hypothetical protein